MEEKPLCSVELLPPVRLPAGTVELVRREERGGKMRTRLEDECGLVFSTSSSGHVMRYVRKTKNKNKIDAIKFRGARENRIDSV